MALYEFIINNVQKVTINARDRTVTVYYNAYDVSVGDFPDNDWSHVQEVVHAHSIRWVDGQGVISTITMDASPFMLNQCAEKPITTVYGRVREKTVRQKICGQFCPTTMYRFSVRKVIFEKEEKDMRKNCVTVEDVYNSMTDAQQKVCQFMVEEALKDDMVSFTPDSIKKVIYNDPATIIFWSDGTKTVVKCMEDEDYDPEKGFMAAVTKKVFGNKYGWVMRHHVKPAAEHEKKVDALMESIADALRRKRNAQDSAMAIRDQMLVSGATHWELETFDRFVRKYIVKKEDK